ncbi:15360_t:CDS:2, partial [Dentiscutata heterogama]
QTYWLKELNNLKQQIGEPIDIYNRRFTQLLKQIKIRMKVKDDCAKSTPVFDDQEETESNLLEDHVEDLRIEYPDEIVIHLKDLIVPIEKLEFNNYNDTYLCNSVW